MHGLDANDVLALAEECRGLHPVDAALALLARADAAADPGAIAGLSIGERDARLLRLRARTLGPRLELRVTCPACAQVLELEQEVADLLVRPLGADAREQLARMRVGGGDGRACRVRALDSHDLAAVAHETDADLARRALAARCLAPEDGVAVEAQSLTAAELDELAARLAALDPQSDILIALTCPNCRHGWEAPLDIAALLRRELEHRGGMILDDVHDIARTYHWSEAAILALAPQRRAAYLAMIRS
jgi:hypothetical protein